MRMEASRAGVARSASGGAGITYPVVVDHDFRIWNAYHNNYWPTSNAAVPDPERAPGPRVQKKGPAPAGHEKAPADVHAPESPNWRPPQVPTVKSKLAVLSLVAEMRRNLPAY